MCFFENFCLNSVFPIYTKYFIVPINSFSYESNGERYIEFDSYYNIYSIQKSYPLT